jgi:hypothetical protein
VTILVVQDVARFCKRDERRIVGAEAQAPHIERRGYLEPSDHTIALRPVVKGPATDDAAVEQGWRVRCVRAEQRSSRR